MIAVTCTNCGKTLKAPPEAAGRRARCPQCQTILAIPSAPPGAAGGSGQPPSGGSPPATRPPVAMPAPGPAAQAHSAGQMPPLDRGAVGGTESAFPSLAPRPSGASSAAQSAGFARRARSAVSASRAFHPALERRESRLWPWLFVLMLVPLVFNHATDKADIVDRLKETVAHHPEVLSQVKAAKSDDELVDALPDGRVEGALLSHGSWMHWLFAAAASLLFMSLLFALFDRGNAAVQQLAMVGGITATVGIINLLMFQWMATHPFPVPGVGLIVAFIGFSYRAAFDPRTSFLLSFVGFTFGVGLCEELTKSLPVAVKIMSDKKLIW